MRRDVDAKNEAREFTRQWVKAQPVVAAYVFSAVRDRVDAEDVLQTVATAALEDFSRYDPAASFIGWALGIARFRVLNYFRTRRRDRLVFGDHALLLLAEAHEQMLADAEPHRDALKDCLQTLPDRQRDMLMLRYREDLDNDRIASRLDMTANAVAIALHRIRQALARCIRTKLDREASHG